MGTNKLKFQNQWNITTPTPSTTTGTPSPAFTDTLPTTGTSTLTTDCTATDWPSTDLTTATTACTDAKDSGTPCSLVTFQVPPCTHSPTRLLPKSSLSQRPLISPHPLPEHPDLPPLPPLQDNMLTPQALPSA